MVPVLHEEWKRRAALADVDTILDWERCSRRVRGLWEMVRDEGREAFARHGIYQARLEPISVPGG